MVKTICLLYKIIVDRTYSIVIPCIYVSVLQCMDIGGVIDLAVTESTSDNFSNAYSFLFHVCRYIAFVLVYALIGMGLHS